MYIFLGFLILLLTFLPLILEIQGILPGGHWLLYFSIPIGMASMIILICIFIFQKRKKEDKKISISKLKDDYLKNENKNFKRTFIKLEDKDFVVENSKEFEERIGTGANYYIEAFLSDKNKLNYGAFFGGFFWLGYRGLIKELLLAFSLFFLLDIITFNLNITIPNIGFIISGVLGFYGNYIYFLKLKNDIKKNRKSMNKMMGIFFAFLLFGTYILITSRYL